MTAAALPLEQITAPGVYELPAVAYHADPVPGGSLSSTGARKLLPPSCPALFHYELTHPRESTKALDAGTAAHDVLLGGGPEVVVIPEDVCAKDGGWSTKEAKTLVAEARARGAVPIKPAMDAEVRAMVAAVRAHPVAGALFEAGTGIAEASLFWADERSGVQRRARLDWLPHRTGARTIIPDLKTAVCAEKTKWIKAATDYRYHQQAAYYLDGVNALELGDDAAFVFVVIEKQPPYLVNVIQLDVVALRIGALLNRRAIDLYAHCTETGRWPGYSQDVELASLPAYYERQFEEDLS